MADLESIWQKKTDDQVRAAAASLADYEPAARAVIQAEFARRYRADDGHAPPRLEESDLDPERAYGAHIDGLNLASRGSRLVAYVIDYLVALVPLLMAISLMERFSFFKDFDDSFWWVFVLAYLLLADALPGGSIGKRLMRIHVVELQTGRPCGVWRSLLRNTLRLLYVVDWLFILGDTRRRLGDLLAGTIVVNKTKTPDVQPAVTPP